MRSLQALRSKAAVVKRSFGARALREWYRGQVE
jgi:hypothetical protein